MAKYDQWRVFCFERWQRLRNTPHRDQLASLNVGLPKFKRLANVDQSQLFARIEPLLYGARCDLEWWGHDAIVSLFGTILAHSYAEVPL